MREFVYYSKKARTSGNFQELMKAGRMDIVCHIIIAALFLSHKLRENIKLHLIFDGPPDPPKHLELQSNEKMKEFISKKDVSGLIKRMLYKYKKSQKREVFPGCFIEKKSLLQLVEELKESKKIYLLDKKGQDIRILTKEELENAVFILGDHEGLPKFELRQLKKIAKKLSLGLETYFASQALIILQNELDRRKE